MVVTDSQIKKARKRALTSMDKKEYQATVSTPIGKIGICTSENRLIKIKFVSEQHPVLKPKTVIAKNAVEQILCYFADPTYQFDIPFDLNVTKFQLSVLNTLQQIQVGSTRSYNDIAKSLKTSPRPVGNACRDNPIPIIIPCHRVVSKKNLGGYSGKKKGPMLNIKRWLLEHETSLGAIFTNTLSWQVTHQESS